MKKNFESSLWDRVTILTYAGEGDTIVHFKVNEEETKIYLEISFLISRPNDQKIVWVVSRSPNEYPNEAIIAIEQNLKDQEIELSRVTLQVKFIAEELRVTEEEVKVFLSEADEVIKNHLKTDFGFKEAWIKPDSSSEEST